MTITQNLYSRLRSTVVLVIVSSMVVAFSHTQPAKADSITDLQKQQAALEQQAAQAAQQAEANKSLAERASDRLKSVSGQISSLQGSIQQTDSTIASTDTEISKQNQQLADLQSQLRSIEDQQDTILRQLYVAKVSKPDDLALFSNEPLSKREEESAQLSLLQKTAKELSTKTKAAESAVLATLDDLNQKERSLQALKDQQNQQKIGLADVQQQQSALKNNAEQAQQDFEAKAKQAQTQASQIAQRVKLLLSTSNWGNQIVSSDDPSWYYTQTGNFTRLGNSYETVNDVGCLITSVAMVSTYYGKRVTPTYIAQNGSFTSQGYYYSGTPAGLGAKLIPGGKVNWATVQREITAGRPVIVSIYLSSVGALNSDGSSHFIVIKGYADGKYLMQDPIGHGRSYNLNQVRSMTLTSKQ